MDIVAVMPDGTLTGRMLNGVNVDAEPRAVELVWIGPEAGKVEGAETNKRPITTDRMPLIKPVDKELDKDIDALYDDRLKQVGGSQTFIVRI